ncbi:MAG: cell division protein SepF [Bacillota bacterium]|jgi:FtsZ-interacting cell division protein YlmF
MANFVEGLKGFILGTPADSREEEYDDVYSDEEYFADEDDFVEEEETRRPSRGITGLFRGGRGERLGARTYERAEESDGYGYEEPAPVKHSPARIVLVKAKRFAEVKRIAENLKQNRSVLINFEDMNKDEAQRTIDFLSGTTFAKDGQIQKISHSSFIFAVGPVDLVGRIKEIQDTESYFTYNG